MITWWLPAPLQPIDGIQQPLPADGKDISLVAVAMFAVYGVAVASDRLEDQLPKQQSFSGVTESEDQAGVLMRFYHCLHDCLSMTGFKIAGVPVEPTSKSDLLVNAEQQVLTTVQSGRYIAIGERLTDGDLT